MKTTEPIAFQHYEYRARVTHRLRSAVWVVLVTNAVVLAIALGVGSVIRITLALIGVLVCAVGLSTEHLFGYSVVIRERERD